MKKFFAVAFAALFLATAQMSFADGSKCPYGDGKLMKFVVVDVACYIAKGESGEKHKACGDKCVKGGGELALMRDGNLYIPVDVNFKSARHKFVKKCDETVEVTGVTKSKGGVNYFILCDAKKEEKKVEKKAEKKAEKKTEKKAEKAAEKK